MDSGSPVKKLTVENDERFPTVAIVVIAVGGYLFLFFIVILIRKICLSKGHDICPSWCAELCLCTACCANANEPNPCALLCSETCKCTYPNKRSCMDAVCPSKEWCDESFCCCLSQEPEGLCSICNDRDSCCDIGEWCGCGSCKDICDGCKCECCAQPDSIDCCCLEIKLAGSAQRGNPGNLTNDAYNNQAFQQQGGGIIGMQPGHYGGFPGGNQPAGYNPNLRVLQDSVHNHQAGPSQMFTSQPPPLPNAGLGRTPENVTGRWSRPDST